PEHHSTLARLLLAQMKVQPSWGDKLDLWLEDKLHMPLTASDIAGALNISISTLQRKVKAELGISIMQYVMQKRLAKSAELLKYTSLTIENIALAVGYD
ncbi:helix-turn-helix transcriptional regulator, partial [Klebsiella aerogenes]